MNPRLRLALRLPAVAFFLITAWFGVLSYVPFAYLQFLRHQLFVWLAFFVTFHHYLYWGAVLFGALSISDDLTAGRRMAWALVGSCAAFGIWLLGHPLLPSLADDPGSLAVGLAALAVLVAYGFVDHVAVRQKVSWTEFHWLSHTSFGQSLALCARSAVYVWLVFGTLATLRIYAAGRSGGLGPLDFFAASAFSFAVHAAAALAVFVILRTIMAAAQSAAIRYALIAACVAAAGCIVLVRIIFSAIAFRGIPAYAIAAAFAVTVVFMCSGLLLRSSVDRIAPTRSDSPRTTAMLATALALGVFAAVTLVEKVDWYFLLQELIAFLVWIVAFVIMKRHVGVRRVAAAGVVASVALLASVAIAAPPALRTHLSLAVDRYAAYDPSLMLIQKTLKPPATELADLTTFLVANSNVGEAHPAQVDFIASWQRAPRPLPNIFIFVIDSLRRDYVSAYNSAVRFTPAIDDFARESLTFDRAFTRYGGTGLSEPSIWSGTLLPHKEYVTPFHPMNALEKLLIAENYHQLISVDSILRQLISPSPERHELDSSIQNRLYDSCRTFKEIQAELPITIHDGRPAFVFTQPQDVHLANVAVDRHAYTGEQYAGFYLPYAARVERLDRCFGTFVKGLKEAELYENSIVVLTSDHGDSLGDEGRWGHAYTVFPEVIRVPLIIHVPERLRAGLAVDTDAVAFTTDITPTLYTLLGQTIINRQPLFGMTLLGPDGPALKARRERPYLVASSYGPVYGVLEDNGQQLYIIDGVNTAEHRYDLRQAPNGNPTAVTEVERRRGAQAIRSQVEEIGRFYGVDTR